LSAVSGSLLDKVDADAGGVAPVGHRTIYPAEPMSASDFNDKLGQMDWTQTGKVARQG